MSSWLWLGAALVLGLAATAVWVVLLPKKKKKRFVKKTTRQIWEWLEDHGFAARNGAFLPDRFAVYPEVRILEENHAVIRKECEQLLTTQGQSLAPMKDLGGGYTATGVHEVGWKTFLFKSGSFVEPNCRRAPETARLLRKVPRVANAFFSVLEGNQHIEPHFGYYKGFLRYHLGVIIPNDNADQSCWIRVSEHGTPGKKRDYEAIEKGETYYWREGEGVLFDDTFLHEAANGSDQARVVLFLDMVKPLRFPFGWVNPLFVWLAQFDPSMRKIRQQAVVEA